MPEPGDHDHACHLLAGESDAEVDQVRDHRRVTWVWGVGAGTSGVRRSPRPLGTGTFDRATGKSPWVGSCFMEAFGLSPMPATTSQARYEAPASSEQKGDRVKGVRGAVE